MKIETIVFPCGCRTKACEENAELVELEHCPLHAAADDLLAACKKFMKQVKEGVLVRDKDDESEAEREKSQESS